MRFSIVIPAYNYGHLLARAVESACTQPGDDYEVLVIDDGSTDNTPAVLKTLQKTWSDLRVIRQENAGPAAVRNRGVRETRGQLLIFLDADDAFLDGALSHFRAALTRKPLAEVLVAGTIAVFADGRARQSTVPRLATDPEQRFLDYLYKRVSMSNGAVAMARELLLRFPFKPELRQTEDIPVFAHCLAAGECEVVPEPVVKIHKHASSRRHATDASLQVGMQLVDEVFDPARLPPALMKHRERYRARRAVSLFRLLYRGKRYREARQYFHLALRANPSEVLKKPENLFKYLRSFFPGSSSSV